MVHGKAEPRRRFQALLGDLKGVDVFTHGIKLYINSQRTKSEAEGWIGNVFFSRN